MAVFFEKTDKAVADVGVLGHDPGFIGEFLGEAKQVLKTFFQLLIGANIQALRHAMLCSALLALAELKSQLRLKAACAHLGCLRDA